MKKTSSSLPTLRQELLVRLAHLQMFLFSPDSLPHAVQTQESFSELLHLQAQSFRDILHLINISSVAGIDKLLNNLKLIYSLRRRQLEL